ncbi:NAD(P)-dependent oxidoreductase [Brevundimonas bacteroides]|uniref:NAD(P)-dependent oxidoreductase n=1 Tax=Brevundimonas bacteroides TaxID=74311 RepID=UPI000497FCD6|nr:NAD(P)-dependent oxidoreductase [Brevundimonas bacteroides]
MTQRLAFIGFGEAASAFAEGWSGVSARAYDHKTEAAGTRAGKLADYEQFGVLGASTLLHALSDSPLILSLVTADQALPAARAAAAVLTPGALYCDMNSVAPETKRAAAEAVEVVGGHYVDVAVMAPVHPKRRAVPLLISGPHAADAVHALTALGFVNIQMLDGPVGAAAAVKMIRSVMVKGIEALSAECILAADRAGVTDAVIASLDATSPGADWRGRFDYNLDRILIHGLRRAAEMQESARTLERLGVEPRMTRGTIAIQRQIGGRGLGSPDGLEAKLALLADAPEREVAA